MTAAPVMTTVAIPVTQEHISRGQPCKSGNCPIALAILDAIPGAQEAVVHFGHDEGEYAIARVATDSAILWLYFGLDAYEFMHLFDDFEPVFPVTLTAEVKS